MTTTNENPSQQTPSPDQPVPDEFDLLCEHCGYSLVGLDRTNRCPECGEEFDPNELPLARIAWLFRRKCGTISSFRQTLWEILWKPKSFAKELCRPVRVSSSDARQFRRVVIRIAAITCLLAIAMTVISTLHSTSLRIVYREIGNDVAALITGGLLIPLGIFLLNLFFRLMSDLPTFIWRGLDGDPLQLAPVHQYASAPLSLLPAMLLPLAIFLAWTDWIVGSDWPIIIAGWLAVALGGGILLLLWIIPLRFMKTATGCGWRRVILLALYLPIHWTLMLAMCWLTLIAVGYWIRSGLEMVGL
jgi:hypothetical protein